MDPTVVAAWIAAGVSVLTLAGTLAAQIIGFRASSRDAEKTAEGQRKQLDRTLAEQRDQLDRTLAEQRTRTLNERFATAAGWAATSQRSGSRGCTPWRAWPMTGRLTGRPASTCCAPTCGCPTSLTPARTLPSRSG
jgi:antitoxin (DNA-binding transcriptional repressor) of toxin-antitoxin stability system